MKYATSSGAAEAAVPTPTRRRARAATLTLALPVALGLALAPPARAQSTEPAREPAARADPARPVPLRDATRADPPRADAATFDREEQLLLGEWRITGVAGHPTVPGSHARLKLEGLRISGYTGCNALGGNYRVERGYLTTGGVITTRRACSAALMRQEAALLALLDQRLAVQQSHRGRLLLTGRDGKTLVLVRAAG